jgi:hypothetical protein
MLAYVVKYSNIEGFNKLLEEKELNKLIKSKHNYLLSDIDGMNHVMKRFNYDMCIDLLRMSPDGGDLKYD